MNLPQVGMSVACLITLCISDSLAFTIQNTKQCISTSFSCGPSFHRTLKATVPASETSDSVENEQPQGPQADGHFSVTEFVKMVDETPPGLLGDEEVLIARDIMSSIASENKDEDDEAVPLIVERLLYRLLDEWETAVRTEDDDRAVVLQPSNQDFLHTMKAWESTIGDPSNRNTNMLPLATQHIWALSFNQRSLFDSGVARVRPDADTFRTVLNVLGSSRERGMDRKVFSIFESMDKYGVEPDVAMYAAVITSLAKSRDRNAAERAESVLRETARNFPPQLKDGMHTGITVDSFNVVLTAWAKSGLDDNAERAEKLLIYMDELDQGRGILTPNVSSFTSLIDAYAQKNDWDGICTSERYLNRLLDQYLEGEEELEPNIASWTIVISAWSRLSRKNHRSAASKAYRLLKRMESLYEEGRISFGPDAIAYVTTMNASAFSKTPDGPVRAEEILNEMHERYMDGDDSMKPTAKSIRIVIDSWVKTDQAHAMEQAELMMDRYIDLLDSFIEDSPDMLDDVRDIYKSMLFGWTKHGDPVRAQDYLLDMIEKDLKPDSFCFDRIIEANIQLNDEESFQRSQEIFELLEELRQKGDIMPNERVYTSFIRAMTKARINNLAYKANVLLKKMHELYKDGNKGIQPTVFTKNAVLMACAETLHTPEPKPLEAFKLAIQIFNDIRNSGQQEPDHVTFGNMLRCANLLPDSDQKNSLIRSTFALCCKRGFVNSFVIRDLQDAAPEELWRSMLKCPEDAQVDLQTLPPAWSRKFQKKKERRQVRQGRTYERRR